MIVAHVGSGYKLGSCESSRLRAYDVYQPMFANTAHCEQSRELAKEYQTSKAALLNLLTTSKFLQPSVERVLYKNVFLNGQREMVLLLRTLAERPALADKVRQLEMTGDLGHWMDDKLLYGSIHEFITSPSSAINAFPLAARLRSEWHVARDAAFPFWLRGRDTELSDLKLSPLVFMALLFFTPKLRTICLEVSQKSTPRVEMDEFTYQYAPLLNLMSALYESKEESAVLCPQLDEVILTTGQSESNKTSYFRATTVKLCEFQPLLMLGNVTKLGLCNFRTGDGGSSEQPEEIRWSRDPETYPLYESGCLDKIRELTLDNVFTYYGSSTVELSKMFEDAKNLRVIRAKNAWPKLIHGEAFKWNQILKSQADSLETFELCSTEDWLPRSAAGRILGDGLEFPNVDLPCLSKMQHLKSLKVPLGAFLDPFVALKSDGLNLDFSADESLVKAISVIQNLELPPQLQTLHFVEEVSGGHKWGGLRPCGTAMILCRAHNEYRSYMTDTPCKHYWRSSQILQEFARQCCPTLPSLRHVHLEPCYCTRGGWLVRDLSSLGDFFDRVGVRFTYDRDRTDGYITWKSRPRVVSLLSSGSSNGEEDVPSGCDTSQSESEGEEDDRQSESEGEEYVAGGEGEEDLPSGYDAWALENKEGCLTPGSWEARGECDTWQLEDEGEGYY